MGTKWNKCTRKAWLKKYSILDYSTILVQQKVANVIPKKNIDGNKQKQNLFFHVVKSLHEHVGFYQFFFMLSNIIFFYQKLL